MRTSDFAKAWAGALCVALACTVASGAQATSAEDKTAADALFDEGKRLLGQKKFAEACPKLEASQKLDPGVGTLLYLGDCYEGLGRTASAWSTFREAASAAKAAGQAPREKIARDRAAELEAKVHRVTISLTTPTLPGLEVKRDDVVMRMELMGTPVPTDPGAYIVVVSAPGKKPWFGKLVVPNAPGGSTFEIPALEEGVPSGASTAPVATAAAPLAAAPPPAAPPRVDASNAPPPGAPTGPHPRRTAGLVAGGVGVGLLALAGGLTGAAVAKKNEAVDLCPQVRCGSQEGVDASVQAGKMADAATASLFVGGALLATGAILFFTAPATRPAEATRLAPVFGGGFTGIAAGRSF